jgi:hypothetical protein
MALGSTQLLREVSTRNLPGGKGRPARKAENHRHLWAECLPRRVTTLWVCRASYRDCFFLTFTLCQVNCFWKRLNGAKLVIIKLFQFPSHWRVRNACLKKKDSARFAVSLGSTLRRSQFQNSWTDFHENWHWSVLLTFVDIFQSWLKSNESNGQSRAFVKHSSRRKVSRTEIVAKSEIHVSCSAQFLSKGLRLLR